MEVCQISFNLRKSSHVYFCECTWGVPGNEAKHYIKYVFFFALIEVTDNHSVSCEQTTEYASDQLHVGLCINLVMVFPLMPTVTGRRDRVNVSAELVNATLC